MNIKSFEELWNYIESKSESFEDSDLDSLKVLLVEEVLKIRKEDPKVVGRLLIILSKITKQYNIDIFDEITKMLKDQ